MFTTAGSCIKFWNIGDHHELSVASQLYENIGELSYSCDGNYMVSLSKDFSEISLNAISHNSGSKIIINKFIDNPTCVRFTNSSPRFFGACSLNNLLIWDIKGRNIQKHFKIPASQDLYKISFSSTDSHTAAATRKGHLFLLSNSNNSISEPIKIFDYETELADIKYSQNNLFLLGAVCQKGGVAFIDTKVGKVSKIFRNVHSAPVSSIIFSPRNEQLLLSVGYDKQIVFYNSNMKKVISSQSTKEPLTCAAFHPNDKQIMLGTITGSLELLDLRMLSEPVSVVKAYQDAVADIKFQPLICGKTNMIRKPQYVKTRRNIENNVKNSKENVPPQLMNKDTKGNTSVELISPIRNTPSACSVLKAKDNSSAKRTLLKTSQTNIDNIKNRSYADLLSPPRKTFSPGLSKNIVELDQNNSNEYLLSPPRKSFSPGLSKNIVELDQNNSHECYLLSPVRKNKDVSSTQSSSTNQQKIPVTVEEFKSKIENTKSLAMSHFNDLHLALKTSAIPDNPTAHNQRENKLICSSERKGVLLKSTRNSDNLKSDSVLLMKDNFENADVDESMKNPVKESAISEKANKCCSMNLSIIQNYIQSEFENLAWRTNQRFMDLHYSIYKQFYTLTKEISQLMVDHDSIYTDLITENIELKEEVERLRTNH